MPDLRLPIAAAHAVRRTLTALRAVALAAAGAGAAGAQPTADVIEARPVRFEIDRGAAGHAGLRISSKLLALARIVESA